MNYQWFQINLKIPLCWSVCKFYYFLQKYKNVLQSLEAAFEDIIFVVEIHKIVSTHVTLPSRAVLRCFFAQFCVSLLSYTPLFLVNNSIVSNRFFTNSFGITQKVASLSKPFCSISPSDESNFEVFWGPFGVCFSIFESCCVSYHIKLCTGICTANLLRNISKLASLCWG